MSSIPPPGQSIDAYPHTVLTQSQLEIREKAQLLAKYNTNKGKIINILERTFGKGTVFWTSHFGLDPKNGMVTKLDSTGQPEKQALFVTDATGVLAELTPRQKNALAQEIMSYSTPDPSSQGVKLEDALIIVSAIPQWFNLNKKIENLTPKIKNMAEEVIYRLESKPDPDSFKIYFEGETKIPSNMTEVMTTAGNNRIPTDAQKKWGYVTFSHNYTPGVGGGVYGSTSKYTMVRNPNNLSKVNQVYPWSAGSTDNSGTPATGINYHVKAILDFYFKAYSGNPKDFWNVMANHRLVMDRDVKYASAYICIRINEVNPNTGASLRSGPVVATGNLSEFGTYPQRLLSEVQLKLFPDLMTVESGRNPKVLTDTETYYNKHLLKAQQIWKTTPSKGNTPLVSVVVHDWGMSVLPWYNDENKRKMILHKRTTDSVESLGPISKMTVTPKNTLRVMYFLQPVGTEAAMRRILIGSENNLSAIEQWFVSHMGAVQQVSETSRDRYGRTVEAVYAVLEHPWIYMEGNGLSKLLNYTPRVPGMSATNTNYNNLRAEEIFGKIFAAKLKVNGKVPTDVLNQVIADVKVVFEKAAWPAAGARKLLDSPVNDEQDLLFIGTKLNSALEGPDYAKPRAMYLPEATNRGLKVTSNGYNFVNGAGVPFYRNSQRYMYNGAHVYYHSKYSIGGVTIRTKTRIRKIQPMTDIVSKSAAKSALLGPLNDLNMGGTIGIIGGGLCVVALGLAISRNRSRY